MRSGALAPLQLHACVLTVNGASDAGSTCDPMSTPTRGWRILRTIRIVQTRSSILGPAHICLCLVPSTSWWLARPWVVRIGPLAYDQTGHPVAPEISQNLHTKMLVLTNQSMTMHNYHR